MRIPLRLLATAVFLTPVLLAAGTAGPADAFQSDDACDIPGGTIGIPEFEDRTTTTSPPRAVPSADAPPELPDAVHLRDLSQTYNRKYWFALHGGSLWFRPNREVTGVDGGWGAVPTPDCLDGRIVQISADDDELVALDERRRIHQLDQILSDPSLWNWSTRWGAPFWTGDGWEVPPGRTWHWSVVSNVEDETWLDPAGNHHRIGDGKVSHIWLLGEDGQRFTYLDPWLPRDESYQACGPVRGRFQAANLVSSGSTLMTVNRYGDIWTRVYDFDIAGSDPVFFSYAYEDQRRESDPDIQLPGAPWVAQPKVPGEITDRMSIFKHGTGVVERTLRVEGRDENGHTGYWEKDVGTGTDHPWINHESRQIDPTDATTRREWTFVRTGEPLRGTLLDNRPGHALSTATLGPSADRAYGRNLAARTNLAAHDGLAGPEDWAGRLLDFNIYCSPTTLRVWVDADDAFDLRLHVTDTIRQSRTHAGLSEEPRGARVTVEVPSALWESRSEQPPAVREFLETQLDGRWTSTTLEASLAEVSVPDLDWRFRRAGRDPAPTDCGALAGICDGLRLLSGQLGPLDDLLAPADGAASELEPLVIVLREALAFAEQAVRDAVALGDACATLEEPVAALRDATRDVEQVIDVLGGTLGERAGTLRPLVNRAGDLADLTVTLCADPATGSDESPPAAPGTDDPDDASPSDARAADLPVTGGGAGLVAVAAIAAAATFRRHRR